MENLWDIYGKFMGNLWEIYGKFMRKEGDNDSQQTPIHGYFQIEYKQVLKIPAFHETCKFINSSGS